jgi:sugar phosphate isomerase/epimerase
MTFDNQPTNASLSTMWAINNYPDLNDFFLIAKRLGFQYVELNHQVDSTMLSKVSWDHYQFSSVHEPCPADISTKDLVKRDWLISSTDHESRIKGVKAVKNSIRLAADCGAPIVIVHCGNVTNDSGDETRLRNLFNKGETLSLEYQEIKNNIISSRSQMVTPRLQAVKKSLLELLEFASRLNIKLGLENRYHYMDIPIIDEMEVLLALADSSRLGFVYDVGHAQALGRLGFFSNDEWLKRYSSRMIGCHLHDVVGVKDHLAPGLGEIDFETISHFLPNDAFRTLEISPGNTLTQVKKGIDVLVNSGCIRHR